jgi:hypothetical protein
MSRKPREELDVRFRDFFKACAPAAFCADDFGKAQTVVEDMALHPENEMIDDSGRVGLYFVLDDQDRVLYVGSTTRAFGARFWDHYWKVKRNGDWAQAKQFVVRALVNERDECKLRYLVALESYLIAALEMPDLNKKV